MSRNVTDHHIIISHTAVCLRFWKIGQWLNAGLVVSDWRWPQRSGAETDTDWWHRLTDVASFRRELKTTGMDLPNTIVNSWAIQVPKPVNEWTSYTVPVHQWRARTEANSSNRSGNAHTHTHSWRSRRLRAETGSVYWPMKCTHLERELPLLLFIDYRATYCHSLFQFFKIFSYVKFTSLFLPPSCIFLHIVVVFIPSSLLIAITENRIQTHKRFKNRIILNMM